MTTGKSRVSVKVGPPTVLVVVVGCTVVGSGKTEVDVTVEVAVVVESAKEGVDVTVEVVVVVASCTKTSPPGKVITTVWGGIPSFFRSQVCVVTLGMAFTVVGSMVVVTVLGFGAVTVWGNVLNSVKTDVVVTVAVVPWELTTAPCRKRPDTAFQS